MYAQRNAKILIYKMKHFVNLIIECLIMGETELTQNNCPSDRMDSTRRCDLQN